MSSPDTPPGTARERDIYTVGRLNREVRLLLEGGLPVLWVEGEISNLARPASGHWYFTLKDRDAQVRCAMFRNRNGAVRFAPGDGLTVLARGRVGLYEPRGDYQFIVDVLEESGEGALRREFEELKRKLAAEGLFASERKRPLPPIPQRVGIITSPSGAAVRDIIKVLRQRFPPVRIIVYPAQVQGRTAAPRLVQALRTANQRAECDVLILARGGGSLEDLWAFNDETLARAIAASEIPVVSAVGHETDVTIADFVADLRAATPSAAALQVVPDAEVYLAALQRTLGRLIIGMRRALGDARHRLHAATLQLGRAHPGQRLQYLAQRLDELEMRMAHSMRHVILVRRTRWSEARSALLRLSPERRVQQLSMTVAALGRRLDVAARTRLDSAAQRLRAASATLQAVSPLATLDRGFAIVTRGDNGRILRNADELTDGDTIKARLAKGELHAKVTKP
ncbi:MAG: exodeoxyribonuclease VII large subunit [Steroidobacteraceae bacterium]